VRHPAESFENRIAALEVEIERGRTEQAGWAGKQRVIETWGELQRTYDDAERQT